MNADQRGFLDCASFQHVLSGNPRGLVWQDVFRGIPRSARNDDRTRSVFDSAVCKNSKLHRRLADVLLGEDLAQQVYGPLIREEGSLAD